MSVVSHTSHSFFCRPFVGKSRIGGSGWHETVVT